MNQSEPAAVALGDPARTAAPTLQLYRLPEVMRLLSLSRSVIYEQIRVGRLKSVTQGRTRLIPASAIVDYISMLEREADGDDTA
jgi:excisionase family DNA binding protein